LAGESEAHSLSGAVGFVTLEVLVGTTQASPPLGGLVQCATDKGERASRGEVGAGEGSCARRTWRGRAVVGGRWQGSIAARWRGWGSGARWAVTVSGNARQGRALPCGSCTAGAMGCTSRSIPRDTCPTVGRQWRRWTRGAGWPCRPRRGQGPGRGRCFAAALAAAAGERWLAEAVLGDPVAPRYPTQRRWIERCGRILGLSAGVEPRQAEGIAEELDLGALEHGPARQRFTGARRLRERGEAVVLVLDGVVLDAGLWPRLLAAGSLGGAWGRPWWWSPAVGRLVSPGSRVERTVRGPPRLRANEIRSSSG